MSSDQVDEVVKPEPKVKWFLPAAFLIMGLLHMQLVEQPDGGPMPTLITADMVFFSVMSIQGNLLIIVLLCLTFLGFDSTSRTAELKMDRFSDKDLMRGSLLGGFCFLVVLGMAFLTERAAVYWGIPLFNDSPWESLIARSTLAGKVMIGLATLLVAPIVEEIVFRHTIYRATRVALPHWCAAMVASAAFAIVHDNVGAIPAFFVLSLILQEAYRRTGRLYVPITMHATFNAFMLTFSQWVD
jgi:membrane protease YdiL (CAAX protease family)